MIFSQARYGLKAGTTLAWYRSSTDEGIIPEYRTLAGFQCGAFAELTINNYFSLQPELLASTRGAKVKFTSTNTVPTSSGYEVVQTKLVGTFAPFYIDLPVYIKAAFASAGSDKFTIGAGPMFSYGINGKVKYTGSVNQINISGEMKLFSADRLVLKDKDGNVYTSETAETTIFNRFDAGISCFASYEFSNRVTLNFNYQYGLKNISMITDESIQTRCLTISLGYIF
jgi:hypothetical protein